MMLAPFAFSAERDLYANAPSFAKKRIKKADSFISSRQYYSAFKALGDDDSDYIIAKKVELCTQFFANTDSHTSFAFKDLKKNEELNSVRLNPGKLDMIPYDVESVAQNYVKQNGETPRIFYALGTYYYETFLLFGDRWIKPEAELMSLAKVNLKTAVDTGFYNARTAQRYANLCMESGLYSEASVYYEKSIALNDTNADALYNYALSLMSSGKYDEGIEPAKKAAVAYKDNKAFQLDAYLLVADAYMYLNNFKQSEKELLQLKNEFPESYLPDMKLGDLYSSQHRMSQANDAYLSAYKKNPGELQWFYQTLGMYVNYGFLQDGISLCRSAINSVEKDGSVKGYLYTFLANLQIEAKDKKSALVSIDNAEKCFASAGVTNLAESLEQMREECK